MKSLSRATRVYLITIWCSAALILVLTLSSAQYSPVLLALLAVCLPLYALADFYEFLFEVEPGNQVSMTIVDAPTIFLAAVAGTPGIAVVLIGTLVVEALRRRVWFKALFNVAVRCIIFVVLAHIHLALVPAGAPSFSGPGGLVAFGGMAVSYYGVNTLLVATILAFVTQRPVLHVLRDSYRAVHWVHFATMPFGALAAVMWASNPWLLPVCILPLVLMSRWFQAIADLQTQSRRNEVLAREQAELAAEREQLLGELRTKQDELIRSSKLAALGTFAAGIGHEFNNLLAGLLGFAQLGLTSNDVRDKDEALEVAVRLSMRGRSITGGLLTFARRRDSQRVPYLIGMVVEETLALVERELAKDSITVVRRLEPTPETLCDPGQIAQVLLNLINNARDAMRECGGGMLTISLGQPQEQTIELRVSDTGHGIPEDLIDQIFQPFVTTKGPLNGSTTPGTGLGLAISLGIVEGHGGTLQAYSTPGEGTTMVVRLPVVAPVREPEPRPRPRALPPMRILLVDDEPDVAEALQRLLESHGQEVTVAASADAALRAYRRQPFDLVISDVVMPGMGGVELVRRLRAADSRALVLAISGHGGGYQDDQLVAAGACGVVHKPFTVEELLEAIGRCARRAVSVGA
ncbi:MAG TPA: ATP-binding protein [Roseiflexaceae bacterium]|nr:ATP-binding protein [Roseiflexaceae bacterium]